MKYILFIIITFIYLTLENIYMLGDINHNAFRRIINNIYYFGTKYLDWNINEFINLRKLEKIPDKFVVISNHINYIDVIIVPYLLMNTFPEHKLIFITRDKYKYLPNIGKYLNNYNILIKNNLEEDLNNIRTKLTNFIKNNKKTMILIFPEGTFMCNDTIKASNEWCDKIEIQKYNKCLAPRINGIYSVLKTTQCDKILETSLIYTDNISNNKGTMYSHILYDNFPKFCCVYMKFINNEFNLKNKKQFENEFYNYWRNTYDDILPQITLN